MSASAVHVVTLPGWLFPSSVFEPLCQCCGSGFTWTHLPWEAALDPHALRAAIGANAKPCLLLAWSLGALAALQLVTDPPPALHAMVLLGATAHLPADPATAYTGVAPAVLAAMRRRLQRDPIGMFRDFYALCLRPHTAADDDARVFVENAAQQNVDRANAGLTALATLDLRADLQRISTQTTLIHGDDDAIVPVEQARTVAKGLRGGRVLTLPHCGHSLSADMLSVAGEVLSQHARTLVPERT